MLTRKSLRTRGALMVAGALLVGVLPEGCVEVRSQPAQTDAGGRDAALDAADEGSPIDVQMDAPDAGDVVDAVDAGDAVDAIDAGDSFDAIDVVDAVDAGDVVDAGDAVDGRDTVDALDVMDAADVGDVADVVDAVDAADSVDAADAVDAVGTSDIGCPTNRVRCGDECVDLSTHPAHCGSCLNRCPAGVNCAGAACRGTLTRGCVSIPRDAGALPSGPYWIDLDGSGPRDPLQVFCDMETEGGGWTLVARVRGNSSAHGVSTAVGVLASPSQDDPAKLSDDDINLIRASRIGGLSESVVRFDCLAQRTYFQQNLSFSARSNTNALTRCSATPTGPWSMAVFDAAHLGLNTYQAANCPNVIYQYTSRSEMGCVCGRDSIDALRDGVMYVR